ncbi:MAG TPA: ABC transporter substrate-binding protein [Burkholderiaceae bacterium]|nr:ABC transporter substrate-binding protein [Burkholderiaceae bacterium]
MRRLSRAWSGMAPLALALGALTPATMTHAEGRYDPGASDTEIRLGTVAPQTGWAKEYGAVARAEEAYFRMVNDRGGVNGRRIVLVSRDDGSDATRSADLARDLVESAQVLALFSTWGTEGSLAIRRYANEHHVPQLFVNSHASAFDDPAHYPWTMGFFATDRAEGIAYARQLLATNPQARVAVLRDHSLGAAELYAGFREGLGDRATQAIVKEAVYSEKDDSVDAQVDDLKASGADTFLNLGWGRFATAAIRRAYDIDWHPLQFIPNASLSIAAFLEPAGPHKAAGVIANARSKGWLRPESRRDPDVRDYVDWMARYNPGASLRDANYVAGYELAEAVVDVLRRCGNVLTRDNVMAQAAHMDGTLPMLRPGIRVRTSPTDYQPIKQLYLVRFDGKDWQAIGAIEGR